MNNRAPFQVIAIIPDEDETTTEKVKQAVAARFDLDLKHYSREFQEEGVCIQHALTLEDALKTTMVVQDLGASCRVLDAGGHVVSEGGPSASDDDDEPALELDPDRDFSGVEAPRGTARDLGADDLVMLDGAIGDLDEQAIPELGDPAVQEASTAKPDVDAGAFGGSPLELDDPGPRDKGPGFEPDDMEFQLPNTGAARGGDATPDAGLFQELDDSLDGKPSKLAMAREDELKQSLPKAPAMDDMGGSRSRRPSQAVSRRGPSRPGRPTSATASSGDGLVMFGGFFRQRPRLRILVGLLLALGLGGVVPAVHASTAYKEQVKPLLVDLATAKANEARKTKAPGVPSTREVEEKIDNRRTESASYTLAIWLGCFVGLAVLWFRFC